jgi:hypothetical protein
VGEILINREDVLTRDMKHIFTEEDVIKLLTVVTSFELSIRKAKINLLHHQT